MRDCAAGRGWEENLSHRVEGQHVFVMRHRGTEVLQVLWYQN